MSAAQRLRPYVDQTPARDSVRYLRAHGVRYYEMAGAVDMTPEAFVAALRRVCGFSAEMVAEIAGLRPEHFVDEQAIHIIISEGRSQRLTLAELWAYLATPSAWSKSHVEIARLTEWSVNAVTSYRRRTVSAERIAA